ncbi:amino acid ABC transporter substrate-binding protein [Catenibacillus scindens]|uniref:amino acid ABC transporter substrate-binding protein n=1 Tax=Catenibacillus scindens TaxID=673271 RepID=UPI00320B6242
MKKFTALCLAGVMAFSLAACGSDSQSGESTQAQATDTQAVTEAAQSESAAQSTDAGADTQASDGETVDLTDIGYDHLIIGVDDTFAPMGFLDENNELVGFDIDLARAAGERLGVEVEFQVINWDMKEQELNQGNVDLIWNGYTITDERREQVNFTDPYLDNEQVVLTMADSGITSLEDLSGKVVAAQINSSAVEALDAHPEISDTFADRPVFDTNDMAIMDMEAGRSDAVVADKVLLDYVIARKDDPSQYMILGEGFGSEEYAVGVRKDDTVLLAALNQVLDEMKADGTAAEISEKWFGADIVK